MPEITDSSAISNIDYDEDSQELSVTMVDDGRSYVYAGVPKEIYDAFISASSKGRYFNDTIQPDYGIRRR